MVDRMSGKICVVTGAARGIGKAIASAFIEEGATVLLTDCDADALIAAGEELGGDTMVLDVQEETHWERLAKLWPAVDVLVNTMPASPGSKRASVRTTRCMPRWRTGAPCTGSISTAPSSVAAMRSGR